jgi:hypothetical protein
MKLFDMLHTCPTALKNTSSRTPTFHEYPPRPLPTSAKARRNKRHFILDGNIRPPRPQKRTRRQKRKIAPAPVLCETAPLLKGAGFGILVPPWWNKKGARLGVKVKMKSKGGDANAKSRMSMENLVRFQWKVSLGETELTEAEFTALAKLKPPLVQIRE